MFLLHYVAMKVNSNFVRDMCKLKWPVNMSVCSIRSSSSHIRLMCLDMVGSVVILLYGVGRIQSKGFLLTSSNSYTCDMCVSFWPFSIAIIWLISGQYWRVDANIEVCIGSSRVLYPIPTPVLGWMGQRVNIRESIYWTNDADLKADKTGGVICMFHLKVVMSTYCMCCSDYLCFLSLTFRAGWGEGKVVENPSSPYRNCISISPTDHVSIYS